MIHYHGTDGMDAKMLATVMSGRHAFISYAMPSTLPHVASVCSTFALDNGAYSDWTKGKDFDFEGYKEWVQEWNLPNCDFHLIPDIIDGDETQNRKLIESWPLSGVPVWHMHESIEWLSELCNHFAKVAIGSSGEYAVVGTRSWWNRMNDAINNICRKGIPTCKLHGLRMLSTSVFTKLPLHSADSTSIVRNSKYDVHWRGQNSPKSRHVRGLVLADRVESFQSIQKWNGGVVQRGLF